MNNPIFSIANWKMNLNEDETTKYLDAFLPDFNLDKNIEVVICPSFTSLSTAIASDKNNHLSFGSQNISSYLDGSFTGEISINMLKSLGCKYVILGHSERRLYLNENDLDIKKKFDIVYKSSLTPILCVGESFEDRKNNNFENVLEKQINNIFKSYKKFESNIIIAYEPIWAIGTGESADIKTIVKTHKIIKNIINKYTLKNCNIWLLYGGSVNEENCEKIIKLDNVDGFLIGGASLFPDKFYNICKKIGG